MHRIYQVNVNQNIAHVEALMALKPYSTLSSVYVYGYSPGGAYADYISVARAVFSGYINNLVLNMNVIRIICVDRGMIYRQEL